MAKDKIIYAETIGNPSRVQLEAKGQCIVGDITKCAIEGRKC